MRTSVSTELYVTAVHERKKERKHQVEADKREWMGMTDTPQTGC